MYLLHLSVITIIAHSDVSVKLPLKALGLKTCENFVKRGPPDLLEEDLRDLTTHEIV